MNIEALHERFPLDDIEWRVQSAGIAGNGNPWARVLAYVTNRAIMQRLDTVCGPMNWRNEFKEGPNGGILCGISVYDEEKHQWVTKWDGADNTAIDAIKGGLSASMKRAGNQWGIGRYLYAIDTGFAMCTFEKPRDRKGWHEQFDKKANRKFYWTPPELV